MVQYICLVVQRCTICPAPRGNSQLDRLGRVISLKYKLRSVVPILALVAAVSACGGATSSTPVTTQSAPSAAAPVVPQQPTYSPPPTVAPVSSPYVGAWTETWGHDIAHDVYTITSTSSGALKIHCSCNDTHIDSADTSGGTLKFTEIVTANGNTIVYTLHGSGNYLSGTAILNGDTSNVSWVRN
jgi:hypothetical protein